MAMSSRLKAGFTQEMGLAQSLYQQQQYQQCFTHLERAHILGQRYYVPHVVNHYWMLKVAWRCRKPTEVLGQLLRIVGSVGSLLGWVPIGNTGGANVSPIRPMTIPADLLPYFDSNNDREISG